MMIRIIPIPSFYFFLFFGQCWMQLCTGKPFTRFSWFVTVVLIATCPYKRAERLFPLLYKYGMIFIALGIISSFGHKILVLLPLANNKMLKDIGISIFTSILFHYLYLIWCCAFFPWLILLLIMIEVGKSFLIWIIISVTF